MSIQSEITRITSARDSSFTAVGEKGVTVPAGSSIDDLPTLIRSIQTGGDYVSYAETQSLSSAQQQTARTNIGAGTYSKPSSGIPSTDLASGVTSRLIPSGGMYNQVLAKSSGTNYALYWRELTVPAVYHDTYTFAVFDDGEGGYIWSCNQVTDMYNFFAGESIDAILYYYIEDNTLLSDTNWKIETYYLTKKYTTYGYDQEFQEDLWTGFLEFRSILTDTTTKLKTFNISARFYYDALDNTGDATITYSESPLSSGGIVSQNVQVAANAWASDNTYANYPYKATITISGVTSSMIPEVVFGPDDAASGNYASVAATGTNAVYIYAKQAGAVAITIPTIVVR